VVVADASERAAPRERTPRRQRFAHPPRPSFARHAPPPIWQILARFMPR